MKQLFSVMFISVVVELRKYFNIYFNKAHKLEPCPVAFLLSFLFLFLIFHLNVIQVFLSISTCPVASQI